MIGTMIEQRWDRLFMRSDVMVSMGLVMILLVMIIPMPPMLLDLALALNITIALMILIITLYVQKSLEFSIFPTVLLITTLFRLSLNVASTRLILLNGDTGPLAAGKVIQSFGQFVVGGNYVVGIVVFLILVVINFIVITKGAGRVAEVSARFTLDAMPGKQMAIDADLNAGLINEEQARARREEITSEADFFGAMDGASKFVRGDAIAGIVITMINICAGFIIGVVQQGMPLMEAAHNYTTLTIGDGLVSQIPALIISTGAGILVSRSGGLGDFGTQLKRQFSFNVRAIWVVGAILMGFALIPGLPFLPFLVLSLFLFGIAFMVQKTQREAAAELPEAAEAEAEAEEAEENYEQLLSVDLLELEVGYGLIRFVDASQDGELLNRIRSIRKQFALSLGFIMPPIHIKDNLQLKPNEYRLLLKGVPIAQAEMTPGHYMAMDAGNVTEKMQGIATVEPAFGLPAIWISEDKKERAQMAGYTVVDCNTVMATHISEEVKNHAHELIGRQEAQNLLDNMAKTYPKLVEELIPNLMSLGGVLKVLQNLLKEGVSIRDLRTILETLADYAPQVQDADVLTEYVRQALSRQISAAIAGDGDTLPIITLDHEVEQMIQNSVQRGGHQAGGLALEPRKARSILEGIGQHLEKFKGGATPVLLCPASIRLHVKKLTERYFPGLAVISHNEVAPQVKIQSLGTVTVNAG